MALVPALDLRPASNDAGIVGAPSNVEAEQALLGAVLYNNEAMKLVADQITAEDFYEPFHQRLFAVMAEHVRAGRLVEPILVADELQGDKAFHELGGLGYLADLVDRAPPAANAPDYARSINDMSLRRRLISLADEIRIHARAGDVPASETLHGAETFITDLAKGLDPGDAHMIDARSSAEATLAEIEEEAQHGRPKGLMTGLRCIDRRLRGLRPGHLVIIAGRPSMGKTAMARQAAFGCASRNPHHQVAFFCLEMARRELDERSLSELTYRAGDGIAYQDMSGDKLTPMDRGRLRDLVWQIPKNFIMDDSPTLAVEYVRRRVWALKRKGPLAAVFIDYLQIMDRPDGKGRNDAAIIGQMTSALKRLAREAEVCVVLLSQINRGVESREDKRPQLSDLRESGSIEQDANAVLFPFREVYYVERAEPKEGTADHDKWETEVEMLKRRMDVLCAKNRGGAVGTDHQEYFAEFDAITDVREAR